MTQINKPTDYFNTKLYSGNGSTQSITGVGFQPDLVWGKERTSTSSHFVFDAVRGATKNLHTNTTAAETTPSPDGGLTSFDSDGFSTSSWAAINESGQTYASWNWKANGAGSANTDGSISSTVSANTTSGFSIVTYVGNATVGATVGHGLSATPKIVFFKNLDTATSWNVIAPSILGNGYYLVLNSTASSALYNSSWTTNSTQIVLADGTGHNASGANLIAYCFAEIKGYSKIGSYTGNGNADGTFVYTGFKPAWIMLKRTDSTSSWMVIDNKRDPDNVVHHDLGADTSTVEATAYNRMDFLSQGFKHRNTFASHNGSGGSYIYMAFAEQPLVGTNNIPTTAR